MRVPELPVETDVLGRQLGLGQDVVLAKVHLVLGPSTERVLLQSTEKTQDEGETVLVFFVIVVLGPRLGLDYGLHAPVPVLSPVGIQDNVRICMLRRQQVDHQAPVPILGLVRPDPSLVVLHDVALAVGDGDVKVAPVLVVRQEAALGGLDHHGAGVVLGSREGSGQLEGGEAELTVDEARGADGAGVREIEGEDLAVAVLEAQDVNVPLARRRTARRHPCC